MRLGVTVVGASGPGPAVSYTWSASAGIVGTPVNRASGSEVVWASLSCLPTGVTPTVTVTATRGPGSSTSHTFPVTWTGPTCTRAPCSFSLRDGRVALTADCTTDATLLIPEGYTFDGQGHTVTAVDPPGGHFTDAVLRNRGDVARVREVTVTASDLKDVCSSGAARLRGILLDGASGEVVDSRVRALSKAGGTSGCQEGFGIEVRNDDASRGRFRVDVLRNHVSGYQKVGLLAVGAVEVTLTGNTVEGGGPVSTLARSGIQVSAGASGRVTGNTVSGNAYTRAEANGAGLLVTGGSFHGPASPLVTELVIEGNTFTDNDIGISLAQLEGAGTAPSRPTRLRVSGNTLGKASVTHPTFQAAIADYGTANLITSNLISGPGYTPATAPGSTFAVYVEAVGPAAKLAFLTPAYEVPTGACSGLVTVQSQDAVGNLVPVAETFTLAASGPAAPGLTFHSDAGCTSALGPVALSGPQAEAGFYFKSTQAGAVTVTVSGGGLEGASQQHRFP
jgi:hypothetical protein